MLNRASHEQLTRRERQIMDVIYRLGEATAAVVQENLPQPPSYSAVRALLRLLEEKEFLQHTQVGNRYVYSPTRSQETARLWALRHMVKTFFAGSVVKAAVALLDMVEEKVPDDELNRLQDLIDQARTK